MNINRAGKQHKAFWRSENRLRAKLHKLSYQELMAAEQGHAIGWIAGTAWAKRQQKKKHNPTTGKVK